MTLLITRATLTGIDMKLLAFIKKQQLKPTVLAPSLFGCVAPGLKRCLLSYCRG
jgi:hypothetical protein